MGQRSERIVNQEVNSITWFPWGLGSTVVEPGYEVKALDESSWDAFAALVEANDGVFGGCWCMGFHPDDSRDPARNREHKLARVRAGTAHAALVLQGEDCVGWCQFGPPGELPRIKNRAAYEKSLARLPDWRIACTFVGKGHRRQGVATAALEGALELVARLGGGTVEGYPEAADSVPAGFLFNGALSTYEKLGFVRDRKIGKHRWVVTKLVEPSAHPTIGHAVEVLLGGWSAAGRARIIQAAVAGRWEQARSLPVPAPADRARALVRDAGPPGADVAVEYEWLGRPLVFVGARRASERASEHEDFEAAVARVGQLDTADPLTALATMAGGDPVDPAHIELGAANAWRSVGPLRLWDRDDARARGPVAERLGRHPALARCVKPVALEVAFLGPRECWLGVEVSEPTAGGHVVDAASVETRLGRLLSRPTGPAAAR